eukprot:gene8293-11223_t
MNEPDELFTLRTLYWLGSYQAAINEAHSLNKIPASLVQEKEEFVYRSYLSLGQYHIILGEIKDGSNVPIGHRAIKLLATFLENPSSKEIVILQVKEWLSDPSAASNKTLQLIATTLMIHDDNMKEAFKIIKNGISMEHYALIVQMSLKIDRLDLAQAKLKLMKSVDEDSPLTMLASAWINMSVGVNKPQDAGYIYEELIDKYGGSSSLLNGLAASKMHQNQFEEAESTLQEALTKAPGDPDTLANLIIAGYQLQRPPEVINRYLSQLKAKAPNHPLVLSTITFQGAFERVAATLS